MGELEARKLKYATTGTEAILMGILIEGKQFFYHSMLLLLLIFSNLLFFFNVFSVIIFL